MSDHGLPAEPTGMEIAIVGMDGRFPQAPTLGRFWELLRDGVELVSLFSDEELLAAGFAPETLAQPNFVKAGAYLEETDLFDAAFFDYSPREAEIIDPQHRLLLESAARALERAGYAGTRRPVGVFAGVSQNSYLFHNLIAHPDLVSSVGAFSLGVANDRDFVATRVAYKLDLAGPAFTVQTACSTSLVAVHLACQSLLSGECEIALAGSATVRSPGKGGTLYHPGGITSSDGHCRAFDARAEGTFTGQGVGVVVLKLLADALADGDHIHAVIRGSAINNDGSLKAGFTAPSRDGQARVIRAAQLRAAVEPDSISYIETHGTATPLGDPIEIAALTLAFRQETAKRGFCAIGSVKTNIGHLDASAGIAGLLKTVLALENRMIPPSLHFERPNPEIDFEASPFYVNARLAEWKANGRPRRAGVSSFGLGGTNAHVVLEEAPAAEPSGPSRPWQVVTLSARTPEALERLSDELAAHLESDPELNLADVAYTLEVGRWSFRHRRALVAGSLAEAVSVLRSRDARRLWTLETEPGDRPVAFLLPGVGDHYPGMTQGLYTSEPVFRAEMDRCAELLRPHLGLDLREALFAGGKPAGEEATGGLDLRAMLRREPATVWEGPLRDTRIAQPAMFAVGFSLARLWSSWGIRPQALLGYSLGEYTAACLAGVLSLEDATALVAYRAQLIAELPAGAMLAVPLPADQVAARLGAELSIAAVNAPSLCVVSGPAEAVGSLERELAGEGQACRRLPVGAAFHSRMMEPIAGRLAARLRSIRLSPPQIAYLSNVTGTWIRQSEATDPGYWLQHLRQTVRFADGIRELWREPGRILLELGPGQTLGSLAMQLLPAGDPGNRAAFSSLRHELDRQPDQAFLLQTLSRLWLAGAAIDWNAFHAGERRRRVPLPTYPYERQRFWIDRRGRRPAAPKAEPAGRVPDMADWFHAPTWKRAVLPLSQPADPGAGPWLLLADDLGIGDQLAERLAGAGCDVVTVRAGARLSRSGERSYTQQPGMNDGWETLLAGLETPPTRIVHLWCLTAGAADPEESQERGFYSLLALVQALGRQSSAEPLEIAVVANGLCEVESRDSIDPGKATLAGPLRVVPLENAHISCRLIDVDAGERSDLLAGRLLAELSRNDAEPVVACRGPHHWLATLQPVRLTGDPEPPTFLRDGGVYLITGGLGGIGLALARHIAATVRNPKLVLLSRTALPERGEWEREEAADSELGRRIREVRALAASPAEVMVLAADVTDREQMGRSLAAARRACGRIEGVFHLAGVPGAGLAQLKTREAAARVLAPKVLGTLVLDEALRDEPPDFLVLFSSIASVTGGVGQVDYCAANAFLDAFARAKRMEGKVAALAVNWGEWQWDRWTDELVADPQIRGVLRRHREAFGLAFEEGMEALRRAMASGLPQLVVTTQPPQAILAAQHSLSQVVGGLDRRAKDRIVAEHSRPALATPYIPPRNENEEKLVALWQEILGIRGIGVEDNFFQLGGHSLLGLQLLSRIYAGFEIELPLRTVFEAPTVAALAAALDAAREGAPASGLPEIGDVLPADAGAMLKKLDQLSEEDVDALLTQMLAEEEGIP